MKKNIVYSFVIVSLLLLFSAGLVGAQTPGNGTAWRTGFFVKNKSASAPANVTMNFFKENNGTAAHTLSKVVAASDTAFYLLPDESTISNGEFSLVMAADQEIVAVANSTSTGTDNNSTNSTTSYEGIGTPGTAAKIFAPNILKDYFGFTSNFYLQNAGGAPANVSIKYFGTDGLEIAAAAETVTVPVGSFIKRDQTTNAALPSGGAKGLMSATFECVGCSLTGVVNVIRNSTGIGTSNYTMFSQGGTKVFAPVVLNNYFGFVSSINVQNNGTGAVNVNVTFSDGKVVSNPTVGVGQTWSTFLPDVAGLSSGNTAGALAATVEIVSPAAGASVVVLVNTSNLADASLASYNGVNSGTLTVFAPASNAKAFGANFDFFTSITCQNLGAVATDLTYTFNGVNTLNSNSPVAISANMSTIAGAPATLAAQAAYVLLLNQPINAGDTLNGFNGATTITAVAPGATIACVINQNRGRPLPSALGQDNLGAYPAVP